MSIERMCQLAEVSRAGFYRSLRERTPAEEEMELRSAIQQIALEHRRRYGYRRIAAELWRRGMLANHKRVVRLMREDNLLAIQPRQFVVTTDSHHELEVYLNLARRMKLTGIDQLWVADITYIRLRAEFVYLAVILDGFSRKVVGWALERTLTSRLAIAALEQAIARRQPRPGLIHHSDRGVQYACGDYVSILDQHQMIPSMSRPANPYDNASCESFIKTLKREEIYANAYENLEHLRANIETFAAVSMPRHGESLKTKGHRASTTDRSNFETRDVGSDKSLFPITDSGRTNAKDDHQGFINERDLERTVIRRAPRTPPAGQANAAGRLGSIPPFGDQAWQAPPYHPGSTADSPDSDKSERDAMEKSSLIYVNKVSAIATAPSVLNISVAEPVLELDTGTRLRARLESAASTAVQAPVLAVIEYNYERDGEIVVPAGAKAVGRIRDANRSGYVDIQFDSLLLPDGASVPIQATATNLDLRPLKGKVEGKNTGKNVLMRSLSGIGQAGSMLIGQGSLNQPLSESDLVRERFGSNIGEAGDEEVSRLAMTQHIVVTVSAGVPIYVILERERKSNEASAQVVRRGAPGSNSAGIDQLRSLLQLQQELSQPTATPATQ